MNITILGKYGPYPAAGGGTSSYLVQGEHDAIVLDFGSGALSRLQKYTALSNVRAIVLSHLHNDHICDLLPLSYALQGTERKIDLILPTYECPQYIFLQTLDGFALRPLEPQMQAGEFKLDFRQMVHPLPSYAVKVQAGGKTLLYSGDTALCPQLPDFAAGSDLMLLDCGKPDGGKAPHLSVAEATDLAESLRVPAIATHLNPALTYAPASPLVTVAEEGKTYTV